jgi:hypothetical protein
LLKPSESIVDHWFVCDWKQGFRTWFISIITGQGKQSGKDKIMANWGEEMTLLVAKTSEEDGEKFALCKVDRLALDVHGVDEEHSESRTVRVMWSRALV